MFAIVSCPKFLRWGTGAHQGAETSRVFTSSCRRSRGEHTLLARSLCLATVVQGEKPGARAWMAMSVEVRAHARAYLPRAVSRQSSSASRFIASDSRLLHAAPRSLRLASTSTCFAITCSSPKGSASASSSLGASTAACSSKTGRFTHSSGDHPESPSPGGRHASCSLTCTGSCSPGVQWALQRSRPLAAAPARHDRLSYQLLALCYARRADSMPA